MMLSYSQLNAYNTCPQQYKFKYIDNLIPEWDEPISLGSALHTAIASYLTDSIAVGSMAIDRAWMFLETALNLANIQGTLRQEAEKVFNNFVSRFELDFSANPQIEHHILLDEDEPFSPPVQGYLDLLYKKGNKAKVIDFKTGQAFVKDYLQAEIYAYLVMSADDKIEWVDVEFDYVRFDYQDTVSFDRSIIPRVAKYILDRQKLIESEDFKPRLGQHCWVCPFSHLCPAMHLRESLAPPRSPQDAEALALELLKTQARLDFIKKALSAYVKENANVKVAGQEIGYFERTTVNYDLPKLVSRMEEKGLDPYQFLSVNRTKFKRYEPEFTDCVVGIKKSVAWGVRKSKEEGDVQGD